jgi:hypothetical protein
LVSRQKVDHQAEYVLAPIAKRFPEKVIDFFGARLRQPKEESVIERYSSVPYGLTTLGEHLATTAPYLLALCETWHRENPQLFEFLGGRLFTVVFPRFTPHLEGLLKEFLLSGRDGAPRFVADVLRGYHGMVETHDLYRLIVDAVPEGDPTLAVVDVALDSAGLVTGEFGRREAYQRKKTEIQPWLTDPRPRVKAFAEAHDRMLDNKIATEQRRSEEDLEARKRRYGDDDPAPS